MDHCWLCVWIHQLHLLCVCVHCLFHKCNLAWSDSRCVDVITDNEYQYAVLVSSVVGIHSRCVRWLNSWIIVHRQLECGTDLGHLQCCGCRCLFHSFNERGRHPGSGVGDVCNHHDGPIVDRAGDHWAGNVVHGGDGRRRRRGCLWIHQPGSDGSGQCRNQHIESDPTAATASRHVSL